MNRRRFPAAGVIAALAAVTALCPATRAAAPAVAEAAAGAATFPGTVSEFHGYICHSFTIDGRDVRVAEPKVALPGHPWVWRTAFWDAFSSVDVALLGRGFVVAFIDGGDTWGCPDAMTHFDAFYAQMTSSYGLSRHPALEGLSRGGLYAYRWAATNSDKVGCLYGDAPLCDLKSLRRPDAPAGQMDAWRAAIRDYHFASEQEMLDYPNNPVDTLAPLAAAHVPVIHVCGDADKDVPLANNTDIIRERYMKLGGDIVVIVKQGCEHHPHGLNDPTPVVEFIVAHAAGGKAAREARKIAPKPGTITVLPQGKW